MANEYDKNRAEIVEEMTDGCGYIYCQRCQRSQGFYKLECHHIMFRSRFPKHRLLHSKKNLIIVCTDCHNLLHALPEENEKLIKQRGLKTLFNEQPLGV